MQLRCPAAPAATKTERKGKKERKGKERRGEETRGAVRPSIQLPRAEKLVLRLSCAAQRSHPTQGSDDTTSAVHDGDEGEDDVCLIWCSLLFGLFK